MHTFMLQTINENFSHAQNSIYNIGIPNITLALSFYVTIQYVYAQTIGALFVPMAMHRKVYTVELVSLRCRAPMTVLISRTLFFY